tara:strand:+ start:69 stop:707 length:639 start_codon:yes stop_codon:yes gene_type:complete
MARRRRSTRAGQIRRTARRAYRRKRRSVKRRSSPKSAGSKIYSAIKGIVPFYVFASQLTEKDYQALENTNYKNENLATKAKIFTNIVTGRLTGFTAFKGSNMYGSESTPFTINPSGLVNKFTGIGVAGMIYKNLPIKQLPLKSKIGTLAKSTLISGALGGLFDAPDGSSNTQTHTSPQVLGKNMSVIQQNRSATMQTGMYSGSNDSVRGSFN